jgi:spore coat protein U-like protein
VKARAACAVLLAFAAARPALAALDGCTVSTVGMAFGPYDPLAAGALNGAGKINVTCQVTLVALLVQYTVKLSTGSSSSYASRTMRNGSVPLTYNVYRNAGRTQIWGDGTASTFFHDSGLILLAVGSTATDIDIWGKVDPGQDRDAGSYSDSITVTVSF